MNNYPLVEINKDLWAKKVSLCSMYTIPAEDDALPGLREMEEMLTRLITLPLEETLAEQHVQYFFVSVFPVACQKIIRSRYFKSPEVLKLSNNIIQNTVYLAAKYLIPYGVKYPKFLDILTIVFSTDQYYFKTNNQISYSIYPYSYFNPKNSLTDVKVGDLVDILKTGKSFSDKVSWSRGQITEIDDFDIKVAYLNDCQGGSTIVRRDSYQIQPFKSKSHTFQWRFGLKQGDLVDYEDSFGSWYNGTITQVFQEEEGNKRVRIAQKVYDQTGPRSDQKGNYYGMSDYDEILDVTSHKLQPYCTVAKQFVYESSKTNYDNVDDTNDYQFSEIDGERVYAFPRKKYLSDLLFQTINGFGRMGGFKVFLDYLEKETNFDVLGYFTKGISGVCPYLHRSIVSEIVEKLKVNFERHIFDNPQKITKEFTKQKSEMVFVGLRTLQKRLYSTDKVYRYENSLKMKLVDSCLQSQSLKKKLQGLNELKDIVKSVTYVSEKNKWIKNWVKENNIFQKIYIINSHVQLIKKSEQFFKYLINQSILEVTDLERLYKMAQKGDYQSRISLYKLFQQMSHIFKKQHVQYLIDTILESELSLILNQDIDLLHELARYSNYFPMEKVISFFENIILGENKVKELNDYAIKKYSQIVAKNHQLKPYRRNIIKNFLQRMSTHDVSQVTKVLKGIFEGIGYGDWGKRDLSEILAEQKVDEVSINTIKKYKQHPDFSKIVTNVLQFLLSVFKLSYKAKIYLTTMMSIWDLLEGDEEKEKEFYRWANDLTKCDQGIDAAGENQEFETFFKKLFPSNKLKDIKGTQFQLAKNFFIQVNKKLKYLSVSNTMREKDLEKQYTRKVEMSKLRLIEQLIQMIYSVESETINSQVIHFFIELYNSKTNTQEEIDQFFNKLLVDFKNYYEQKEYQMAGKTIKLIEVVINDSEKNVDTNIESLTSKKKFEEVKFLIINETIYSSDVVKKVQKYLPMNLPVIRLRKMLAKEFNLTWQQIKIVGVKEIPDYQNSRTLKQIKLNPNTPLTVSRRVILSQSEGELILGDQMNPKVVRCFQVIFDKYSTNGKMDKDQCNGFTATCLGSNCTTKYYSQKISNLYNTYDDDNDGFLTFQNFIRFYEDAARDRPSTVWSNLRSFGVKGDFRFNYQPEEEIQVKNYPRVTLAQEPKIYDILFDLLRIKGVAEHAFELLERLPVSKQIQTQLLNITFEEDLDKIFDTKDHYELFYKLNVVQYLAYSNNLVQQSEKQWQAKFIQLKGYEKLFACVQKLQFSQQQVEGQIDINKQILYASLCLLNEYWVQCFSKNPNKLRESIALIAADFQIDEKIQYLVTGSFPQKDQSLSIHPSTLPPNEVKYQWRGIQKAEIISSFLSILKQMWDKVYEISLKVTYDEKFYILSSLIYKLFDVLDVLLMNENPCNFIEEISVLLDKLPSSTLLSKLYCFIMCQCFYASEQFKYQGIYIRQLFKNLTKQTITSEHFRVLAVLVSKFGLGNTAERNEKESEETEKMKKILFENVSHNNNELTVEGCAKLLCNFNLEGFSFEFFKSIWEQRLFNPDTICQKKQTKDTLYQLILKLCEDNANYTDNIIGIVKETIEDKAQKMKIVYCNEFKERSSTGFVGLKNLGNICYMNSMIQQLFMNKSFRYLLLRVDDKEPNTNTPIMNKNDEVRMVDDNFLHQIQRIFAYLEKSNRIDFAPHDFCVAYKPFGESVNIMIQQDVQEFVSMFFDRLEQGLSQTPFKKLVHDFYLGKTVNLFKCHSCQKTKKVEQNFHSITLEVKNSKSLSESFNKFNLGELINDYTCDFCKQKVDVSKKTRISKTPKVLIIHLQRIVFNLDTFIEEKISNKHSFPLDFNLHQYTLDYYERKEANQADIEEAADLSYSLIGIVCHTGNAAAGHYISYIKTDQNKWLEFNDSLVSSFNPINIESECFGGTFSTSSAYDDQYDFDRRETSKSAYLLIYEKKGGNTIEMVMDKIYEQYKNEETKQAAKKQFLKTMSLQQVIKAVRKKSKRPEKMQEEVQQSPSEKEGIQTGDNMTNIMSQSQGESSAHEDSETQTKKLLQEKQREIKRHNSQDHIDESETKMIEGEQNMKKCQGTLCLQQPISPFISTELAEEIRQDNIIHFIERCLSSESFTKFFANLLIKSHKQHEEMLPLCQKLTFGFWLKSPCFKDLLNMLDQMIHYCPSGFQTIIVKNPAILTLLIENSDAKIRSSMANFLAKAISDVLNSKKVKMDDQKVNEEPTIIFLDHLLSLLPTTVSKCWTKFSEYFQFWCEFSTKGEIAVDYMMKREVIKHFMDYFLHDKSPLKISVKTRQHSIGSSYASPNFSMLLKCISSLLKNRMEIYKNIKLSDEEEILIMSCESLQKLIADNYEAVACQLVKQLCPHNLFTSEKTAMVILKGISKSNYETIQPYLEVLHDYVMIEDEYQDLRIKWVVGKQTLALSSLSKKIIAMNSYSYDERIYNFDSSIHLQSGASLLDPIFVYYKRIENYSFLCLRAVLKLCNQSTKLRKYIFNLSSPTISMSKYVDFFKGFIDKYVEDSKRAYAYYTSSSSGFNKEQLAQMTKLLYQNVLIKVEQDQVEQKIQETKTEQKTDKKQENEQKNNTEEGKQKDIIETAVQNIKEPDVQDIEVIELKQMKKKSQNKENNDEKKSQVKEKKAQEQQECSTDKVNEENNIQAVHMHTRDTKIPVNSDQEEEEKKNPSEDQSNNSWEEEVPDLERKSSNAAKKSSSKQDQYAIHVIDEAGFMDLSSEEQQPLMKSKEEQGKKSSIKEYKQTWHPVKFEFNAIGQKNYLDGVQITEHQSDVTFVITKPTGTSNQSFTSSISSQKTIDRILPAAWENQKTEKVHGFFVRNTKRENIRIQTDDGCQSCKGNDSCWVWAREIVKVFQCEKTIDWPKWTMYPKNSE